MVYVIGDGGIGVGRGGGFNQTCNHPSHPQPHTVTHAYTYTHSHTKMHAHLELKHANKQTDSRENVRILANHAKS